MTDSFSCMQNSLTEAAMAFRLGSEGEANEALTDLIDTLGGALPLLSPKDLATLSALLPEILAGQNRQDFLKVADLLEYRLAPLIGFSTGTGPNQPC